MIKGTVKKVDADHSKRLLLVHVRIIEHPNMDNDLIRFSARLALETNA